MAKTGPRDKATIEALKERMAKDPLSRAFLQLAEEYRKAGRYEEAVQVCQEGLARHPGYHTARIALGRTYLEAGDLENARVALMEVLDTMPENHLAGKLLGDVQTRLGDLAGAAGTYRAILNHYPGNPEIEALLSGLEKQPGLESLAVEPPAPVPPLTPAATPVAVQPVAPMSRAIPPSSDNPAGSDALQTNTLAELYLRQGLEDKAVEVYRAMLRVDPANERARRRLQDLAGNGADMPPPPEPRATVGGGTIGAVVEMTPVPRADEVSPAVLGHSAGDHRRAKIARLEQWIATLRGGSGSTGEWVRR